MANPFTGSPATSLLQSGQQNELPQTNIDQINPFIQDFGERYCLENRFLPTTTPSWHALDVRGNSQLYQSQVDNYGLINIKVIYARKTSNGAPVYANIFCDGIEYVIQVNQVVRVPSCVLNVIQNSSSYGAVVVP
jgi:hypothetical protein